MARDATVEAPNVYTVVFENERVRLLEARVKPGDSGPLHSHPDGLAYVLTGGEVTFITASGHRVDVDLKSGQTLWRQAEEHSVASRGSEDVVVLMFEPK